MGAKRGTVEERFWRYVSPEPNSGCWLWEGALINTGYGLLTIGHKKQKLAHRISYEIHKGPIPIGLELDHRCYNTACVNPSHLEAVTHAVNTKRGRFKKGKEHYLGAKTKCRHGHEFTEQNTVFIKHSRDGHVFRSCRLCAKARKKRQNEELKLRRYLDRKSF
ncbi:MAG: HNH endonuclease [Patescibacteria group bacterium]|nr:HNH endonuclease [Patescibacteria group bacterium]